MFLTINLLLTNIAHVFQHVLEKTELYVKSVVENPSMLLCSFLINKKFFIFPMPGPHPHHFQKSDHLLVSITI